MCNTCKSRDNYYRNVLINNSRMGDKCDGVRGAKGDKRRRYNHTQRGG